MTQNTVNVAGFAVSSIWFAAEPPGTWTRDAECRRQSDFAEFFTEASTFAEADLALTVCADCPVRAACLAYGQQLRADGVWGGRLLHRGVVQHRTRHSPASRPGPTEQPAAS